MSVTATEPDWRGLVDSWDRQQTGYIPPREQMFTLMIDAVRAELGDAPRVLDLGCGPGGISERLLARLSGARAVALDLDPVLLAIGQGALGTLGGRLRWVEADLRDSGWTGAAGDQPFDAVLTATALHWLPPEQLAVTYRQVAGLLRPGGLLLNADRLRFDERSPTCARLAERLTLGRAESAFTGDTPDWTAWWHALDREPSMRPLLAERERRLLGEHGRRTFARPSEAFHLGALADAGFREMGTIWQDLDRRLLLAVR